MKKIFTILLTICVLGANAQETETITSLGNYQSQKKKDNKNKISKKINWIYQFQNTSSYQFTLANAYTAFSGGTDFFNNPNVRKEELYGAISKYYKDAPSSFAEALDFNQTSSGEYTYRFNSYDFIDDFYYSVYGRSNLNLINFGIHVPVTSW